MCVMTNKLKERFCKDLNLPIKVYDEPYFSERLKLYDKHFHCLVKYNDFISLVNRCGGEQQYFELYNKVKDSVICYLRENEYMKKFSSEEDFSKYKVKNAGFPKSDIYRDFNNGKCFISLDMRKGNFTALHHYDKRIVANMDNYKDFLGLFTKESHLLHSKYIRQVVFGNINPRRQVAYEQYLMDIVLSNVLNYFDKKSVVFFSTDEIVLCVDENKIDEYKSIIDNIVECSCKDGINIRAEFFTLHKVCGTDGFLKKFLFNNDGFDIKGVNSIMMPFVLRKLYGQDFCENDCVFVYEGMLAKLIAIPNIEIEFNADNKL